MKRNPTVSVLMNCFNGERYLRDAIRSIYAQTYKDWEIIFIDNCSVDDSAKISNEFDDRLKYYKTHKNITLGEARNWGMQFVRGKYLAFLDVDDLWLPDKLRLQVNQLENNPDYYLSYTGSYLINEKSVHIGKRMPKLNSGNIFPDLLKHYEINQQAVLLRFNREYCNFSSDFKFSPDYNIFMRVSSKYKIGVIKQYLVKYRKHGSSITSKMIDRWWIESKMTLDSILESNPSLKEEYPKEVDFAYAKINFKKSLYYSSMGDHRKARLGLKEIRYTSKIFFLAYLLSLCPAYIFKKTYTIYSGTKI